MRLKALFAAACAVAFLAGPALAQLPPFHWLEGATVPITTGNTSANVALLKMPTGMTQLRFASACATTMFIRKGADSSATATATDLPILAGEIEVLTVNNSPSAPINYIAMISPSGSCTLYITAGSGI